LKCNNFTINHSNKNYNNSCDSRFNGGELRKKRVHKKMVKKFGNRHGCGLTARENNALDHLVLQLGYTQNSNTVVQTYG
jgi:hypothetical protein